MAGKRIECGILFADIADSTELYEKHGDARAQDSIAHALGWISDICQRHSGTVIKTVGDEILCCFASSDEAILSCSEIHTTLSKEPTCTGLYLSAACGLHFGTAIMENEDLFGDSVNVAARLVEIARAQQTITTQSLIERLSPEYTSLARPYDQTTVRGKHEIFTLYEMLWGEQDLTQIVPTAGTESGGTCRTLSMSLNGVAYSVRSDQGLFLIGRGTQCDLVIDHALTSRVHALVEYRRGKFVLVDQSTNGTYVQGPDGTNVYLRREAIPLLGSGAISTGAPLSENTENCIRYQCE